MAAKKHSKARVTRASKPARPDIVAYLQRFNARPTVARTRERDEALLAEQAWAEA
jgi:hypothetical protein